ncbi:nitrilase-related carbon-nitrogen hydrolase [uncultured Williamsia sp.]|uniref:carbon-nitrogen hydrolase family protein n=1 Tax=uncultured Williamsia sp. TaxID=259311 RepID=UPI0026031082|nr:nitrilase-related carbon-nitrogen hydrolase [uncultured Williamsia sp.]
MKPAGDLTVCVAQPAAAGDLSSMVGEHARMVLGAGADLVVFPELSLTGYHLQSDCLDPGRGSVLDELVAACEETGSTALVGAPVREGRLVHIATLRVDASGSHVAYRKCNLGDEQAARFSRGPGPAAIDLRGWRVGLGICRDTGVAEHVEAVADLGIDLYACGVVHHRGEVDEQMRRATHIAQRCWSYVVMASHAGPTGHGYDDTAGNSVVVDPTGRLVTRADDAPGTTITALLEPRSSTL